MLWLLRLPYIYLFIHTFKKQIYRDRYIIFFCYTYLHVCDCYPLFHYIKASGAYSCCIFSLHISKNQKNCQYYNKKLHCDGHFPLSILMVGDFYCWHCCLSTYPSVGLAGSVIIAVHKSWLWIDGNVHLSETINGDPFLLNLLVMFHSKYIFIVN